MVFWLITAFRCGFKQKSLAVISTRLDKVWKFCVEIESKSVAGILEVDEVEMYKCGHKLELLWMDVLHGVREARAPYCEGGLCWMSLCFGCGENRELAPSQTGSLALSSFLDGHVNHGTADHIKSAALG
jgi:hypothetical protein